MLSLASAAMVASDDATELFEQTLAIPGAERWPFELARIQLVYGEALRRGRAIARARTQLGAALDTFERLDAKPWATRAGNELRATGPTQLRGEHRDEDLLSSQDREIAELAAAGLTNKQIGERLFLSPRTVGAHLYRVFPKLGVTSRAALRGALDERDAASRR
jgi:DNA-binding CsgD family transcriptional regulator